MIRMKTTDIGRLGEISVARLLKKQGFKILERNIHVSHNEIDIIALNKRCKIVAFVEVKARSVDKDMYSRFGTPAAAVTKEKQRRTIDAAKGYLRANPKLYEFGVRFDVAEVYLDKESRTLLEINHIENAFGV